MRRSSNDEDGGSFKAKSALSLEAGASDPLLGPDGVGFVWTDDGQNDYEEEEEDDDDDEEDGEGTGGERPLSLDPLRASSMGCIEDEARRRLMWRKMPLPVEEEDDDEDFDGQGEDCMGFDYDDDDAGPAADSGPKSERRTSARTSAGGGAGGGGGGGGGSGAAVFVEVVGDMVTSGHTEGHPPENLLMEIKGYKFAQNKVTPRVTHSLLLRLPP